MKNKVLITLLSCGALLSLGSCGSVSNNLNNLSCGTYDIDNDSKTISLRNVMIGTNEDVKVSRTYVQYGQSEEIYYLRFVTALSGNISSATYTRSGNTTDTDIKAVSTVYRGIKANNQVYYYNENGVDDKEKLSTDEAYMDQYYWACYTIAFETGNYYDEMFNVSLSVVGENQEEYTSVAMETSLNQLIENSNPSTPDEKSATIEDIKLFEKNDNIYYAVSGSYTGEIDKEFVYFDLKNSNGFNLGGKDKIVLELDESKNQYTMYTDITGMLVNTTSLYYYYPTVFINNVEQDLTDSTSFKKSKTYLADDSGAFAWRIDQNKNTNQLPAVRYDIKDSVVPEGASFAYTTAKMEKVESRIYFKLIGTYTGYNQVTLGLNLPDYQIRYGSTTNLDKATTECKVLLTANDGTFEVKFDVTDFEARKSNYNPYYIRESVGRNTSFSYLKALSYSDVSEEDRKPINYNTYDYVVFCKDKGDADTSAGNAYGSVGFKVIIK